MSETTLSPANGPTTLEGKAQLQQELFSAFLAGSYEDGRDEMNLSEFPITAVGNRVDPSVKTLVYEDMTRDSSTGETVKRRLTVTASDAYGLPAAIDDELLLGMVQLSRIQGFTSQEVFFTPYQLLQILGWPDHEAYYRRLKEGLRRWAGVLMSYENAWRDKATGRWVDAAFHFIDNVEFHRRDGRSALARDGLSYFKWNDVIFKSFQAGNLKQLDFSLYRQLNSGLAKRLFRFLDKRFYHQSRLTFDLQSFAFEKVGITRANMDAAQIKRRLMPGIQELEAAGYIAAVLPALRFTKTGKKWNIHFERNKRTGVNPIPETTILSEETEAFVPPACGDIPQGLFNSEGEAMEARLVTHGVSRAKAKKLVAGHTGPQIELQIEILEFLTAQGRAPNNPGGWLNQAILSSYSPPPHFKSRSERQREEFEKEKTEKLRVLQKRRLDSEIKAKEEQERLRFEEQHRRVNGYLENLTRDQRLELEKSAVKEAGIPVKEGGALWDSIIAGYVLNLLEN